MAQPSLTRQVQASFTGGMYRNGSPELIPADGAYELSNALLDLLGGVSRRGGSSYRSTGVFGVGLGLRWIWDGWLASGQTTLVASTAAFGKLEGGGGIANLGEGGLSAPVRPAAYEGKLYFPGGKTYDGTTWGTAAKVGAFYAIVANRLLAAEGSKVLFSEIGKPGTFAPTDFHQLPGGVQILGLAGGRDSAVVFTTGGIWVISNLALNLTDAAGNVQQRLDHYSGDLVLWGDAGISSWEGSLIVPGTDAVWLVRRGVTSEQVSSFVRISDSIRDLYRSYVKAGYQPGLAAVFGNHYLLPIIGAGQVIDLLVCRLDIPPARGEPQGAWTHFGGLGAGVGALTVRVSGGVAREPELLGAMYGPLAKILTLSYFTPTQDTHLDADGSVPEWSLETRSIATGSLVRNLVSRLRVRYQLSDAEGSPRLLCELASDAPVAGAATWGTFVWGVGVWSTPSSESFEPLDGEAPPDLEASTPFVWSVRKKRRTVRFRLSCKAASAQLSLKALEIFVRPQGRI